MSLDTESRSYPFNNPEIRARAHAKAAEWRRKNPVQVKINAARALARANAAKEAKRAKRQHVVSRERATLNVTAETKRRFMEFSGNSVSVDTALNMLLDAVKDKKIVAKPTAVIYTLE